MSAALAFSHGANDAQKSIGVIAALLLAAGQIDTLAAPTWAKVGCATALTVGTALGGWRIIATVGRRIYRIRPEEGLSSQTASAGVIFGSSLLGAPVSTTQVVASSDGGHDRRGGRLRHLADALSKLGTDDDGATASAYAAIAVQRELETAYYAAMVRLLGVEDRTDRITRRELYRRSSRIGEAVTDVAERVVYAVVKQS